MGGGNLRGIDKLKGDKDCVDVKPISGKGENIYLVWRIEGETELFQILEGSDRFLFCYPTAGWKQTG